MILDQGLGLDGMQVGGAYSANPLSCCALYWNPAALRDLKSNEVYFSDSKYFNDLNNRTFVAARNINENMAVAIGYLGLMVSDISYRDNSGQSLGSNITYSNEVFILGLGCRLSQSSNWGVSYKYFKQNALEEKWAQSLDLAYKMKFGSQAHFGLVAENLAYQGEDIYPKYRAGLEQDMGKVNLSLDILYDSLFKKTFYNYGFAYSGLAPLEIKGGVNGYLENYFLGISLKFEGVRLDYMFCNPELGMVHRFGLGINF